MRKDLHLKCFKRRHAQELTDVNCAARMKGAKHLLQQFPQYATDFNVFTDEKVFSVTSPDNRRTKSVVDKLKTKFHYAIWSQTGWRLVADLQRAEIWPII